MIYYWICGTVEYNDNLIICIKQSIDILFFHIIDQFLDAYNQIIFSLCLIIILINNFCSLKLSETLINKLIIFAFK